jgi:hypothetical protein
MLFRSSDLRLLRLVVTLAAFAWGCGLVGASIASAASPSVEVTVAPDPVESIATQLGASGSGASTNNHLDVTVKPSGGTGCAANPSADSGEFVIEGEFEGEGLYSHSVNWTFPLSGSYLVCAWLLDETVSPSVVVAQNSARVSVRPPHLSLSIAAPPIVTAGLTFQLTTVAQAETEREVREYITPNTGDGCPANAAAAAVASRALEVFDPWQVVGGPLTNTQNEELSTAGAYLVCAYFEYPESQSSPELATGAPFTVVSPCIVPALSPNTSLAVIKHSITSADCGIGSIRYVASRKVRRGFVISLSPHSSTSGAPGTKVAITVSNGPPCVVPRLVPHASLGSVEHRIRAAGCSVGHVRYRRSRSHARGTVLTLSPGPGKTLAPRAPIQLVVSRGR